MSKKIKDELVQIALNKGRLTDYEFRCCIISMFLQDNEWILDTGDSEMVNAEFVLRLKGKEKKLHKIFWRKQ